MYREADGEVRRQASKLGRKRCECEGIILCDDIEPDQVAEYETKKLALQEEVAGMEEILSDLKVCRRATPKHVMLSELPAEDQFKKLGTKSKYFIDTIKLIAYRAETAMVNTIRPAMHHPDEARSLLRSLYAAEADLLPDHEKRTLTVRLHQPANRCSAVTVEKLCQELNATKTKYSTDLRLVYKMVS